MLTKQSGPKKYDRAVILCGDQNVVDFARFIFMQIAANEPERDYDLVFCTPDKGVDARHPRLPEIRVCEVNTDSLSDIPTNVRIPVASSIKISLPVLFQQEYKQIIYLDTDVFLRKGRMSDLFAAAHPGRAVSAVLDGLQWQENVGNVWRQSWRAMGIENRKYLNAGVLVFDVASYCQQDIFNHIIEYSSNNKQHFLLHDQDAINGYLNGDWAPLSLKWNWQTNEPASRLIKEFNPNILHFIGASKPYLSVATNGTRKYLAEYAAFYEQVLEKPLIRKTFPKLEKEEIIQNRIRVSSLIRAINRINLFYHTGLRGLGNTIAMRRHLRKIERAIADGNKIWPPSAMRAGEKDT